MIPGSSALNSRRWRNDDQQQQSRIEASEAQLYKDVAQASGGQVFEVATSEVPTAINLLTKFSGSSVVMSQRGDYRLVLSDFSSVMCSM